MKSLPFIDAKTLTSALSWSQAIDALDSTLATGLGIAAGRPRTVIPTARGELLLMPGESAAAVGVKLLSIAPDNPGIGLPRIQAVYVLFDAATLTPRALLDGACLTTLRTPALSALAVRHLAAQDASTLTVFGSGPQAAAHVHAMRAIRPIRTVSIVGRNVESACALCARLRADGCAASIGNPTDVQAADIVICATTSREPVFDGRLLAEHTCVVAVGSHEPDARELDDDVFARAERVVVEDRGTALREAGDIVMAIASGALTTDDLTDIADLAPLAPVGGITVFKSVGMGWQDLAVAEAVYAACQAPAVG